MKYFPDPLAFAIARSPRRTIIKYQWLSKVIQLGEPDAYYERYKYKLSARSIPNQERGFLIKTPKKRVINQYN